MTQRGDKVDGRYELTAPLDDRGCGECWRARDGRVKNRVVMLRLLRPLPDGGTALPPALKAHGDDLRQLRHPAVLTTHELGLWQGRPYLVHDLFEGPSLGAGLDKARGAGAVLSLATIELFFERVMTAVEAGHLQVRPVAHGAIGPGSVFVQRLPGASFDVRVTDFGLLPYTNAPTASGSSTRGLLWAAPERMLSDAPTKAGDVYQLGRLLELMLTSPTSADGFHDEAPRALGEVIARATEADPARRFESIKDLREAFRRALVVPAAAVAPAPVVRGATMIAPMPARRVVHAETRAAPMPERPTPAPVRAGTQAAPMPERTVVSEAPVHHVAEAAHGATVVTPAAVVAAPRGTSELEAFPAEGPRWGASEVHQGTWVAVAPPVSPPRTAEISVFPGGLGGEALAQPVAATRVAVRDVEPVTGVVVQGEALAVARFDDAMNPWDAGLLVPYAEGPVAAASDYTPTTVHVPPPAPVPYGMPPAAPGAAGAAADDRAIIVKTAVIGVLVGVALLALAIGAYLALR